MSSDVMRPDDLDLLRRAGRNLRRAAAFPVVFGGLRQGDRIPVSTAHGAQTDGLTTIVITPTRGLGGKCWRAGRLQAVTNYADTEDITHDFDAQILGERIVGLCAAPVIVGTRVMGLLYAGYRSAESASADAFRLLEYEARRVAHELHIRDLVDERIRILRVREACTHRDERGRDLTTIYDRLLTLADETKDPDTARELRSLLNMSPADGGAQDLTPRQTQVIMLVALGLTNEQIAARLGLSILTVKSYLRAAMARLGAHTRYQAVVEAQHRRIIF
ncbi:LuxR C-terminal-related transcriptional regulator [Streptomyces sp. NBS 14/10]|uniref:LuxR C-terminal-related transcriptional regulator n=1 Tax=Streptomyces sp. NBS 14/10 TaxID=1945643 RepID=UPI000B7F8651|nr:LuxR C-terminal-related transcriptional regulator [Streptomyces sp. NBS 14/10]KAK1184372.1 LuxR C-terminal-related transcriptional regulator [Streptomyces sp. NBS 14/10]